MLLVGGLACARRWRLAASRICDLDTHSKIWDTVNNDGMSTLRLSAGRFFWAALIALTIMAAWCPRSSFAAETLIAFENVTRRSEARLSNQVRHVIFEDCYVTANTQIRNSPSLPLSAATSGSFVATSYGSRIHFSRPVRTVKARVSPAFIAYNGVDSYHTVYLVGYDRESNVLAIASVPLLASVENQSDITAFIPVKVRISSRKRVAFVTLDLDSPYSHSGTRFMFDDLRLSSIWRLRSDPR